MDGYLLLLVAHTVREDEGQGKGYQTRMNALLREAMLRSLQHKA